MSEAIGEYNRKIEVQRRVGTGALNQPSNDWETFKSPWAKIRSASGMSVAQSMATSGIVDAPKLYSFRLLGPHRDINENHRIVIKGAVYDIKTVRVDEANWEYTDIVAETGQSNG